MTIFVVYFHGIEETNYNNMIIIDEQIMKAGTKYILRRMEFNYE